MKSKQKCFKVILNMSVKIQSQFSVQAIINFLFSTASGIPMSQVIAPKKYVLRNIRPCLGNFCSFAPFSLTEPNFTGCEAFVSHFPCCVCLSKLSYRQFNLSIDLDPLCDPIDGSPPGSPIPGILQERALEWGTIAFSIDLDPQRDLPVMLAIDCKFHISRAECFLT